MATRKSEKDDFYEDSMDVNTTPVQEFRVYPRRWIILAIVCLLNVSSAVTWLTFASVANIVADYYEITISSVNMLSLVFLIISIPLGFITTWFIDTCGLRSGVIVGAVLNLLGCVLRLCSTFLSTPSYPLLMAGQCVAAAAQPFILFTPTKMAALWFPDNHRAIANTIASMGNPFGLLLANLISPALVKDQSEVQKLLWVYTIPAAIPALMAIFGFTSSTPPTPPSASAAESSEPFLVGVKQLVRNRSYLILFICFGGGVAAFTTFTTMLQQILCPYGYDNEFVGLCGALLIAPGVVGAAIAGVIVDKTKMFTEVAKISFAVSVLFLVMFAMVFRLPGQHVLVALSCSLFGLFGFSIYPICLELGVECSYPVAEATSAGFSMISGQIQGIVLILLMQYLVQPLPEGFDQYEKCSAVKTDKIVAKDQMVPVLVFAGIATLTACAFVIFFKTDYKRLAAERTRRVDEIGNTGASST